MKITLTKKELLAILIGKFGGDITDVEVTNPSSTLTPLTVHESTLTPLTVHDLCRYNIIHYLKMSLGLPVDLHYIFPPNQKISAIKAIRICVPGMGLQDAKWAIENWSRWIGFVAIHERIPDIHYSMHKYDNLTWME